MPAVEGRLLCLPVQLEAQRLPNLTHPSSPVGEEEAAAELDVIGEQRCVWVFKKGFLGAAQEPGPDGAGPCISQHAPCHNMHLDRARAYPTLKQARVMFLQPKIADPSGQPGRQAQTLCFLDAASWYIRGRHAGGLR